MRSTRDEDIASKKATMKLIDTKKKFRMQKYYKDTPLGRVTIVDSMILLDKNGKDQKHPYLIQRQK